MKPMDIVENKSVTDLHSHCETCVNINKCMKKGWTKCDIVSCSAGCGFRYHACKGYEHSLLCPNAWVPCINCGYGCPKWMMRKHQGTHLYSCPASVVMCTMEWNRWPVGHSVHTADKSRTKINLHNEQLDVSLALRDQQMLEACLQLPSKTKEAFCNSLTALNPAVPILMQGECNTQQEVEDRAPPGLQKSVCSTLCNSWNSPKHPEQSSGGIVTLNGVRISTRTSTCLNGLNLVKRSPGNENKLITEAQCICSNKGRCGAINKTVDNEKDSSQTLWLDLALESITKYQSKPKAMYTFLCAQEFRRDEFPWHYKNVHSDIHGGLDGWLEHRCPQAHYGCPFSQRRLQPLGKGSKVLFNDQMMSFGVVPPVVELKDDMECEFAELNLSHLPFEVLRHVTQFLDSFSLYNLSMCSRYLRSVCASVLENKGMVRYRWQKVYTQDGKATWDLGHKHWAFSSSFASVTKWSFVENEHMANHMKTCKYFDRVVHKQNTKILYFHQEE